MRPDFSHRTAFLLSCFTVGYNVFECVVSLLAGWWPGSIALVGFGLDSFVESLSGTVMLWRFWKHRPNEDAIEAKAVRLVGCTFLIVGFYVLFESGKSLYFRTSGH